LAAAEPAALTLAAPVELLLLSADLLLSFVELFALFVLFVLSVLYWLAFEYSLAVGPELPV
jgi:hypothetical protein